MADAPPSTRCAKRMIEDMTMRGLAPTTQRNYVRVVRACAKFARKPPGELDFDDARAFLLHLMRSGASRQHASTRTPSRCASSSASRWAGAARGSSSR